MGRRQVVTRLRREKNAARARNSALDNWPKNELNFWAFPICVGVEGSGGFITSPPGRPNGQVDRP